MHTLSLKERTKLKGLLEVVSSSESAEFETIPIRRHEDALLRRIYERVPVELDRADFEAPHFKTFLLPASPFLAHTATARPRSRPGACSREDSQPAVRVCRRAVVKCMAECARGHGSATDVCTGHVKGGFSAQADPAF